MEEFKRFCDETGYLDKKGRKKGFMTIERMDDSQGYSYNNIIMIEMSDNSRKAFVPYFQKLNC